MYITVTKQLALVFGVLMFESFILYLLVYVHLSIFKILRMCQFKHLEYVVDCRY